MTRERRNAITATRVWIRSNIITTVLGIFIVVSLALHVVTLLALVRVRDVLRLQLDAAAAQVAEAQSQKIHYDFPLKQSFPFSTTITIDETLVVPIRDSFPINQTFEIPVDTGFGVFTIPVPLNLSVPVSTTVVVPVKETIPFSTEVMIDTLIPLDLDLSQPPLGELLTRIEATLRDLRSKL